MSRPLWTANLDRLCREMNEYAAAASLDGAPAPAAEHISESLFLAHSAADASFSAMCSIGLLKSAARLDEEGIRPLSPDCEEALLDTAHCVFLYLAPFRYPRTTCGFLFARTLEIERMHDGAAAPFDTGGLVSHFGRADATEPAREFLSRHTLPVPDHRRYLAKSLAFLFGQAEDYLDGVEPVRAGPIGLTGGDLRRWTHEVRIPSRIHLRSGDLQAVFVPRSRAANDAGIESLLKWCLREDVDTVVFDTPMGGDFEELRRQNLGYIRKKLDLEGTT